MTAATPLEVIVGVGAFRGVQQLDVHGGSESAATHQEGRGPGICLRGALRERGGDGDALAGEARLRIEHMVMLTGYAAVGRGDREGISRELRHGRSCARPEADPPGALSRGG